MFLAMVNVIGDVLLDLAEVIVNLTSGIMAGEEEYPE